MTPDFLQIALNELVPNYPDWYSWAKNDSDGNKIPNDQRMQTKYVIVNSSHEGKVTRPTDKEINDKIATLESNFNAQAYARNRQKLYPNGHDLIVALWEKVIEGRTESADALEIKRQQVKTAHPKPK